MTVVSVGLGVGLSQTTSLSGYNGSCTNTSNCATVSQYGLMCINNTCTCNPLSSYNGISCGMF